jgi:hypothetical protein
VAYIAGSIGKYDKRVLRLIRRGRLVVNKRGKAYSGLSGKEVGSVKRGLNGTTDYVKVSLPIGKKKPSGKRHWEWFPLHRAIALAFYGLSAQGHDRVNHIDGNGLNNKLKNLEWCSAKENTQHAIAHGTFAQNGELNQMALLTEDQARAIILSGKADATLASEYGVGPKTIQTIRYGMRWKHVFDELKDSKQFKKARRQLARRQQIARAGLSRKQIRKVLESAESVPATAIRLCIPKHTVRRLRQDAVWLWARRRYQPAGVVYATSKMDNAMALSIFKSCGSHSAIAKQFGVSTTAVSKIKAGASFGSITKGIKRG